MLHDDVSAALALTHEMRHAMMDNELDLVEQLAQERDEILQRCFSEKPLSDSEKQSISPIVDEIIQLNNEMIEQANKEKSILQAEVDKELRTSSGIRKYIENMSG